MTGTIGRPKADRECQRVTPELKVLRRIEQPPRIELIEEQGLRCKPLRDSGQHEGQARAATLDHSRR